MKIQDSTINNNSQQISTPSNNSRAPNIAYYTVGGTGLAATVVATGAMLPVFAFMSAMSCDSCGTAANPDLETCCYPVLTTAMLTAGTAIAGLGITAASAFTAKKITEFAVNSF